MSVMIVAEIAQRQHPRLVLRGRYRRDPLRAMTAMQLGVATLTRLAVEVGLVDDIVS